MAVSPSSTAQAARQRLADELRTLRNAARLTGRGLAAEAGWHGVSKVSKIEHGVQPASVEDIRTWCRVCGVPERADDLIAQALAADSMWVEWKRSEQAGLRHVNVTTRELEEQTRLYRAYSAGCVPVLLQTDEYATAILSAIRHVRHVAVDDIAGVLQERAIRKHLMRSGGHRYVFLLEAQVLAYRFGGPQVLARQLEHLLSAMTLPSVVVGIIPVEAERTTGGGWPVEDFFCFDEREVQVELVTAFVRVTQPSEVTAYVASFNALRKLAVFGTRARALITAAREELREQT